MVNTNLRVRVTVTEMPEGGKKKKKKYKPPPEHIDECSESFITSMKLESPL